MNKKIWLAAVACVLTVCLTACGETIQVSAISSSSNHPAEDTTVYFKSDKRVNHFFVEYASIAEYQFEPDDIKQGNVRTKALISKDGLYIELVNSTNGLTILMDDGPKESDALYPIFRDFLKVIDESLLEEQIEQAWSDIKDIGTKYYYDGAYTLNDLKLTYSDVEFQGSRQVKVSIYAPEYQE